MVKILNKSDDDGASKNIRFAFLCETPLHVLNAINFAANDMENSLKKSDIYIYHCFKNSYNISQKLREKDIFCNVFDIEKYDEKNDKFTRLRILFRLFFPKKALKRHMKTIPNLTIDRYQNLVLFSYTMRTRNLLGVFKDAKVLMLEDGIGSYFGNQIKDYVIGYYKILDKYVFFGKYDCDIDRIYLYHPELCQNTITSNVLKLPDFNMKNPAYRIAQNVYSFEENDLYKNKCLIYFTQPLELIPGGYMPESESKINDIFSHLDMLSELLIRVHPKQSDVNLFGCDADTFNNFWELESISSINDEHILVSSFSTAAFTPKYMNDTEPYIIFTYKLAFKDKNEMFWVNIEKFIEKFKQLYSSDNKIFIPDNYEEFQAILEALKYPAKG